MGKFLILIVGILIFSLQNYLCLKENKWLGFIVPVLTVVAAAAIFISGECKLTMENTLPFVGLIVFEIIIWFLDINKNKIKTHKPKEDFNEGNEDLNK